MGMNTIKFKMTGVGSRGGLMYDCIKLEMGKAVTSIAESYVEKVFGTSINCYPNPFKHEATFQFNVSSSAKITLAVYNIQGQLVEVLCNESLPNGLNKIRWKNSSLPSGIYIYQFVADKNIYTGKIQKL